ncbi:MAG: 50S ribosomal protein L30e [Candidatus Hodarchaeaceae archaeon]|nr:50S ribosomal protein L30e [Candidatus Hodarchaeaceae archaeon]
MNREIRQAVDTGKVILGTDKSMKALKLGQAKLVILASNCPKVIRTDIERYARLANIPIHVFQGDSAELGLACGKPFLISVAAVMDPGNSNILGVGGT